MEKTLKCPICGQIFTTTFPHKKYCSISCREAARIANQLKWADKNPQYRAEYMRKWRKRQKEKES